MALDERDLRAGAPHHVILEGRAQLSVSGVEEVGSFDESSIVIRTNCGALVVSGEDLHIEQLSLDGGELKVTGTIDSLAYEEDRRDRGGFLARLLG